MEPIYLLGLASRKSAWLAARQTTVADNIANMNTPAYKQKDLVPFSDVLAQTHLDMVSTSPLDLPVPEGANSAPTTADEDNGFEITESGNTVGMESQLDKANQINREYALTTNIVKSFHDMLMASLKG